MIKTCEICSKTFTPSKRHPHQKYCSKQCREQAHLQNRGITLICQKCNQKFQVQPSKAALRKYCSGKCAGNLPNPITKKCLYCGQPFIVSSYRANTAKWCSLQCYNSHRTENPHFQPSWEGGPSIQSVCQICGVEIWDYKPRRYCSYQCVGLSKQDRKEIICAYCGHKFSVSISSSRSYCSLECFHKALPNGSKAQEDCFAKVLRFLKYPPYQREKTFSWLKSPRGWPMWLDLYIPSLKLAVEYDGEQHFHFSSLFHNTIEEFHYYQEIDSLKGELCACHDIQLIRFRYNEQIDNDSIATKVQPK